MKVLKIALISVLSLIICSILIGFTYLYFTQESMIFIPTKLAKDYHFKYKESFEELSIPSADKTILNGLLFKTKESKGLVFYLHGNAGAIDSWGDIAEKYNSRGYDLFILDYRGFGKSGGEIESEEQFYGDISAAYKELRKKYEENKIIIIGYSIGTGPAAYLASQNHPKALILQAPYYSLTDLAHHRMPYVPIFLMKYRFETNVFIPKITAPIYIFHGNKDEIIPIENSIMLSKLLKPTDRFYVLPNQGHGKMNDNEEYLKELSNILNK